MERVLGVRPHHGACIVCYLSVRWRARRHILNVWLVDDGRCDVRTCHHPVVDATAVALLVPPGNFDAYGLAAALNARTTGVGVSWSYDSTTLKMTATCASGTLTLGGGLCVELLDIPLGSSGTSISSSRTVRLTGVQSILVDTDLPGQNVTLRASGSSATTLARVCNDVEPLVSGILVVSASMCSTRTC